MAEHVPLQLMVPLFLLPHAFAADWQEVPYPEGFAGTPAQQAPLQLIVPVLRLPHAFAADWHEVP